ncbi:MAG: hypothetical protein IRY91_04310 [Gemmatimonadaceae bacterium]|nr:hypothetical protein [Gemmatimonadaceae bacterium]
MLRGIAALIAAVGLSGCAQVTMSSMRAPEARRYGSIMVFAPSADLSIRNAIEQGIVDGAAWYQLRVIKSEAVFFPGRVYPDSEVQQMPIGDSVEAVLVLAPTQEGATTATLPTQSQAYCTYSTYQGCLSASAITSTPTVTKPWGKYVAALIDVRLNKTVWIATGTAEGSAFTDRSDLANAIAVKTLGKLAEDAVIEKGGHRPRPAP